LPAKPRFFYGYWIVLVAFCLHFVTNGFRFYAFGIFTPVLQQEMGWGRGEIYLALTLSGLAMGLGSPLSGRLVDRYGVKPPLIVGAFITGGGLALLSQTTALWQFLTLHTIAGLGTSIMGMIPASAMISNWFKKRRGFAMGLAGVGTGAGGFIMSPIIGGLLIPGLGWRNAYLVLGLLAMAPIISLAIFVVKTRPGEMGLFPDGAPAPEVKAEMAKPPPLVTADNDFSLSAALRTPAFWLVTVSYTLFSFPMTAILQNQVAFLSDIGYPMVAASVALGAVGICSAIGKFGFGLLCDYIKPSFALAIGLAMQLVALIIMMTVDASSPAAMVWIYSIIYGLGIGCWLPTLPMIVTTTFGLAAYGAIYGTMNLIHVSGSSTGPLTTGLIFDATGSYNLAFTIFLILYIVAIGLILVVRRPKSPGITPINTGIKEKV